MESRLEPPGLLYETPWEANYRGMKNSIVDEIRSTKPCFPPLTSHHFVLNYPKSLHIHMSWNSTISAKQLYLVAHSPKIKICAINTYCEEYLGVNSFSQWTGMFWGSGRIIQNTFFVRLSEQNFDHVNNEKVHFNSLGFKVRVFISWRERAWTT